MQQLIEQNLVLILFILATIGTFAFYYFVKFKPDMDEASEKSGYDFWGKIFGKYSRIIVFLLFFIGFPLFVYFVLIPIFSVDTSSIQTIAQAQEQTNNTSLLYEYLNKFGGDILEKGQENSFFGGLIILGIGLIMLVAIIMDANWILDSSAQGSFNFILKILTDSGNRKKARILMLIPTFAIIFLGLLMIFGYFAFG